MKINCCKRPGRGRSNLLFLKIKFTVFLLFLGMLSVSATTYSQNTRVDLNLKDATLPELFDAIQKQTDYLIFYRDKLLKKELRKTVHFELKNAAVADVLTLALAETGLTYTVNGRQIIITPKEEATTGVLQRDSSIEGIQLVDPPKAAITTVTNRRDTSLAIRGRVYDTHEPPVALSGVTITVKGTSVSATTDADGYFSIRVSKYEVLVFSRVSFKPVEYTVSKSDNALNISMKEVVNDLEQIVVVGLSEQKKKHIASSVATLDVSSNITGKPITTLSQSLQGGVTGLQVTQSSGLPGGDAAAIKIRGISTLGNSDPLVLVDGIPMDMNYIDPVTVQSVTVLKDAAAAAIYGARAANGVIVVTTKRGIPGKVSVTYDGYVGIQSPACLPKVVEAPEYMRMYNDAQVNAGKAPSYSDSDIVNTINGVDPVRYPNTNWIDEVIDQQAPLTSHSLAVSGGNNVARFALTGNYLYQKGMLPINNTGRFNIRANTSVTLSKNFTVNLDMLAIKRNVLTPNRTAGNNGNRLLEDIYRVPPTILPKYPKVDGRIIYGRYVDIVNPVAYAERGGQRKFESGQTSINLQPKWRVIPGLNLRGQFSFRLNSDVTRDTRNTYNFFDYYTGQLLQTWTMQRAVSSARTTYYYLGANADYTLTRGNHMIFAMAGYSQEETNSGDWDVSSLISAYAKLNYSYKNKYLFEGTVRTDGSSRFSPNNRFGYFPSVALGWNVHNENFLKNVGFINNFKLRASYGYLGNENIGLYKYQTLINSSSGVETTYGNPDITWETVHMADAGADIGLFNGKLEFIVDYYNKTTNNIILNPALPLVGGFEGEVPVNAGKVENKGWEVSMNYNSKVGKNASISIRPGVSYNTNTILSLVAGPYINSTSTTINQEGSSIGSLYGYKTDGLLQADDFDNTGKSKVPVLPNAAPGDIKYLDLSEDGEINAKDQTILGNPVPQLNYFSNFRISYKKIDLEFLLQGTGRSNAVLLDMFALPLDLSKDGGVPTKYYAANYWTPERTGARYPRLSTAPANNKLSSDFWFQNGAYVRVKFIQLGLDLTSSFIRRTGINSMRMYLNAQNPLTFTRLKLTDPESRGNQWTYGIMKTYTIGCNIQF
ncbi:MULTISPECIES: TonB-dependent receptor [Niastella]|uniref:TonB-dependent receptor n=1 Tax=Niastella soli TaxID=2821487 RepID=A0ABS3Z2F7_9BACT|nr:TonB-dependent receptor [Niastella soli]MBO9203860.1 TonB-dependent receptor [Niastella soli]